ncbi:MAG TPA: response regulator [Gaiellaceae bacterium]|nr:response regulator [Gaiellaceae bacterium]
MDDSLTSLMWQRMILGQEQYSVVTANDGQEGVATAMTEKPDLILMDVVMPKMNGFEACRAIRANSAMSRVPVIMVTTKSAQTNVEEGYQSGCNDYITKPIDKMELLTKVKSYLGQQ